MSIPREQLKLAIPTYIAPTQLDKVYAEGYLLNAIEKANGIDPNHKTGVSYDTNGNSIYDFKLMDGNNVSLVHGNNGFRFSTYSNITETLLYVDSNEGGDEDDHCMLQVYDELNGINAEKDICIDI